jgi:hypothetical protein
MLLRVLDSVSRNEAIARRIVDAALAVVLFADLPICQLPFAVCQLSWQVCGCVIYCFRPVEIAGRGLARCWHRSTASFARDLPLLEAPFILPISAHAHHSRPMPSGIESSSVHIRSTP